MQIAQKVFVKLDAMHNAYVYKQMQLAINFTNETYKLYPWFLEYKEGRFPSYEEMQYNATMKERTERACRALVQALQPNESVVSSSMDKPFEDVAHSTNPSVLRKKIGTTSKKRSK